MSSDAGWEMMPDELKEAVSSMGRPHPPATAGDAPVSRTYDRSCTAPAKPRPKKHGPEAGLPPAYAGCGHRLYGGTNHCAAMLCSNYINKCPRHGIGGGSDATT